MSQNNDWGLRCPGKHRVWSLNKNELGTFLPEEGESNAPGHGRKGLWDRLGRTERGQGGWSRARASQEAQDCSESFRELTPRAMLLCLVRPPPALTD